MDEIKELQELVNEYMPKRYYGHEARRYAKVIAKLYAEQVIKNKAISDSKQKKRKQCCAEEIKRIWESVGGSMNVVHYESTCPKCGHYIGLTQTSKKEAIKFLKEYGLIYTTYIYF